jgi:hypothetical protein
MSGSADYRAVAQDGQWLAHRYDPEHDAVHLLRISRQAHRAATFITDEYLPSDLSKLIVDRAGFVAATPPAAPVHFIFHSAFCCSTVLVRAFDIPGVAMGLKEPPVFNDIVGWRHRGGGPPARVAQMLDQMTGLLARPLAAGEAAIIKPSNLANGLARGLLAIRKEARALLLYAPLETYLKSIAKKEMDGRLWVRDLLVKLLKEGLVDLGFTTEDYLGQTDLQVAAVGWLAQHALFARLANEFPDRVRTLDSETLLAQPDNTMRALARLYGLALSDMQIGDIVAGPAFTTHSKSNAAFGVNARATEYDAAAALHHDEIAKVIVWADAVAKSAGVATTLPAQLIP